MISVIVAHVHTEKSLPETESRLIKVTPHQRHPIQLEIEMERIRELQENLESQRMKKCTLEMRLVTVTTRKVLLVYQL